MPSYNTRLRANSVLLPPRRLRLSPEPPPRPPRPKAPATPDFPPPALALHPDDDGNKTLAAIGRALLAVDNRATTIKDLSHLVLDSGLLCQNVSAASQAITTYIRNHLARCHSEQFPPLLRSLALTGSAADDRLAPALHSRSGGTSSKDPDRTLTSFRRGTTVWYLSEHAGAPCPFQRAGIVLDDVGPQGGTKRKRNPAGTRPRKRATPGPALATRARANAAHLAPPPACLRVKLTLRVPDPAPESESDSAQESDPDDVDDTDTDTAAAAAADADAHDDDDDDVSVRESPPPLPPYPILSPSIPSPQCATPATSLASPSAPCAAFLPLRTALSNPPFDFRARSSSLPFSCASPPPDSEDEDHDFHNSMVGLRRGSVPLKQEHDDDDDDDPAAWTIPLELLPGFEPAAVKAEPTSAVLPPPQWVDDAPRWDPHWAGASDALRWPHIKREHPSDDERTVLDPDDAPAWGGKGTQDDPVRVDPAVGDVEVLGPESVRSRDWDAAWAAGDDSAPMDVDPAPCASPPAAAPAAASSPPHAPADPAPAPAAIQDLPDPACASLAPLFAFLARPLACGIRAEDVFAPRAPAEDDVPDLGAVRFEAADHNMDVGAGAGPCAGEDGAGEEEGLFGAFVEFGDAKESAAAAAAVAVPATASAHAKENVGALEKAPASAGAAPRRKRDKPAEQQVRRSKRGLHKPGAPVTRSRSRARI